MSEINYQALREAAERAIPAMERLLMLPADDDLLSEQELKDYGVDIDALNAFKFLTGPETVLALLDERERNQQYIKSRDQENEDIALTVGKLRVELEAAEKRIAELEAEPVSQAYNLAELIEGMEVSIDVSTCDADLGNRYFGTVTEALELDTAKNGYILLVQDAEPNFDVNGNYPVTPDGWISCSERMPDSKTAVLVAREFDRKGDWRMKWATYIPGHPDANDGWVVPGASWIPSHWMPLPEPPQEVNRG
ncbi:ead/Ea22-like family protein [Escherichia coli]|uniref:ead/Ea22-like family protein n=2 Tax=Escherichia coli TaxID=562 RepID=UPI001C527328|nr:ead/Ea22-like family protein [Escherichia coli]MBW1195743.1 ead/Ea22-like family protein [Escherichia coli]MBW1198741.1 ead/Ea22-like family protein [Escherichia coli]